MFVHAGGGSQRPVEREQSVDSSQVETLTIYNQWMHLSRIAKRDLFWSSHNFLTIALCCCLAFFLLFPLDLQSFRDELNRSSKTAFADIWADEDLQRIFVFLQFSLSNWRYSCIVHCNIAKSVNLFSQGLEVKAEEIHLWPRLQLTPIWACVGCLIQIYVYYASF